MQSAITRSVPSAFALMQTSLNPRLLLVAIIWGVNFAFVKYALADFSPLSFTTLRFFLAALFLFSIMLVNREPLAMDRRDISAVFKLGFIGITLYNILFMEGLNYTTASNSALFISSSPLFAALILSLTKKGAHQCPNHHGSPLVNKRSRFYHPKRARRPQFLPPRPRG